MTENLTNLFETSDIRISAYLLTEEIPLIDVITENPNKVIFCFSPNGDIRKLLQDYWTNRAKISPRALFDNLDYLKGIIHKDYQY